MRVISATARHINVIPAGATGARIEDANTGRTIGFATRIRGFIHYDGQRGSAHAGVKACVASTGSTFKALELALAEGLRNGRDDSQRRD